MIFNLLLEGIGSTKSLEDIDQKTKLTKNIDAFVKSQLGSRVQKKELLSDIELAIDWKFWQYDATNPVPIGNFEGLSGSRIY